MIERVVTRYRCESHPKFFAADAAIANPEVYEFLEPEDFSYAIRLPGNAVLEETRRRLL